MAAKFQRNLFCYKDARFGCLSKAAPVAIYTLDNINDFLEQFPSMNNRLACLVREVMDLPYLKAVLVAWAALGLPFSPSLSRREPLTAASPRSARDSTAAWRNLWT